MNVFEDIVRIFQSASGCIKRKYPKLKDYVKHLDRIRGDDVARDKEVQAFKNFLAKNSDFYETKSFREWTYRGPRGDYIFFKNVVDFGADSVVERFWEDVKVVFDRLYPDGIEKPIPNETSAIEMLGGEDSVFGCLVRRMRGNVILEDILAHFDTFVKLAEKFNDEIKGGGGEEISVKSILMLDESAKIKEILIEGVSEGRYKAKDIIDLIEAICTLPHVQREAKFLSALRAIKCIVNAAERRQVPDAKDLKMLIDFVEEYIDEEGGDAAMETDDSSSAESSKFIVGDAVRKQVKEFIAIIKEVIADGQGKKYTLDVDRLMHLVVDFMA